MIHLVLSLVGLLALGVLITSTTSTWRERMANAIAASLSFLPAKAQMLVLAHAAYESGDGRGFASQYNNPFNLTRTASDNRPFVYQDNADWEFKADGTKARIGQKWRAYSTLEAGVADYWQFIGAARYGQARSALSEGNLDLFLSELYRGGYFTLPLERYRAGFMAELSKVSSPSEVA